MIEEDSSIILPEEPKHPFLSQQRVNYNAASMAMALPAPRSKVVLPLPGDGVRTAEARVRGRARASNAAHLNEPEVGTGKGNEKLLDEDTPRPLQHRYGGLQEAEMDNGDAAWEQLRTDWEGDLARCLGRLRVYLTDFGQGYQAEKLLRLEHPVLLEKARQLLPKEVFTVFAGTLRHVEFLEEELRNWKPRTERT